MAPATTSAAWSSVRVAGQAHTASGKPVHEFEDVEAVAYLRRGPRATGITTMSSTGRLRRYYGLSIRRDSKHPREPCASYIKSPLRPSS